MISFASEHSNDRQVLPNVVRWKHSATPFAICLLLLFTKTAFAEEPLGYNRDVRPVLAEYCFACHGPDSAARKADLRLDQREAAVDSGAITPGDAEASSIWERIISEDHDLLMPPPETKKTMSAEEKEIIRRWLSEGAEYEPHWSFIKPSAPEVPAVSNEGWVKNDIDRFVLSKLEAAGLQPAPEASPEALFRRLHLDITGLPPSPSDVASFVADYRGAPEVALSEWIDRLMQSTAWGEHRGRYWLDAARYGDTHGLHFDNYREIWPYRDWVIRAFNKNLPYDQFVVDQLAGDLLPEPTIDQLIATGFQRCNITTNEGGTIDEENLALYATDRVQTFGWVFLGLTTNCAQCHDHKFDPFSMHDYYALAAYFRNTTQGAKDGNVKDGLGPAIMVPSMEDRPRWEELPELITKATQARDARREAAREDFQKWLAAADVQTLDQQIPSEGLLLQALLNEGSGNEVAISTTATADQPLTSAQFKAGGDLVWEAGGKLGSAPTFNPNRTIDVGNVGDFRRDQAFSYGAWVKAGKDNVSGAMFGRMDQAADYRGWDLWQQGRNFAVHIIDKWPDNALKVVTQDPVLQIGQWQHLFATYDGSGTPAGVKLYVNGKPVATRVETNTLSPTADIQTTKSLKLGQRSENQFFESGSLQDVRVYSANLTPAQVQVLAEIGPLREILSTPADQRTAEQTNVLYEHYLAAHDQTFSALAADVRQLESEREAIRARSPVTHIQKEKADSPPMANILMRGEYDKVGEQVTAAPPAALHPLPTDAPNNRLGLAKWVVDVNNPLTARVTVNRFWQEIFGQGLVVTAEDFGIMGALPTHPELLDWLAIEFQSNGWDMKRFYKLIFSSATYRQAAITTPEKLEGDRNNALLSRGPRFRMDAEMVRDLALSASGLLDKTMYGPGVKPYQPEAIWDLVGLPGGDTRNYVESTGGDLYRRTVYTFWKRMAPPPSLEAFNAPSREVCTVRRERTNTPLQALVTLNDPQYFEAARVLAQNAIKVGGDKQSDIVDHIAQEVLGRSFNDEEMSLLLDDYAYYLTYYQATIDDAKALLTVGKAPVETAIDPATLAAWTMVCNQVLNLDEALNK